MLIHLSTDSVIAIHEVVLAAHGGGEGLRDRALLESAISAPQATFSGVPIMTDPTEVGAAYLFYLTNNHPFIDGNKRTALATCLVFLKTNNALPGDKLDVDLWEALVIDVASSKIDRSTTTVRLRELISKMNE